VDLEVARAGGAAVKAGEEAHVGLAVAVCVGESGCATFSDGSRM
jgi:hypothetical protein